MESNGESVNTLNLANNEQLVTSSAVVQVSAPVQRKKHKKSSSSSEEDSDTEDDLLDELALNEEYYESASDDDSLTDEEYENEDVVDRKSLVESLKENNIVLENTLKHNSFFETTRDRRRRHLEYRSRGNLPTLHFTGSHRTEFWGHYGVEPNKVIPPGNVHGIHTIFTEEEFKKLGPTERRIHIHGQKFKVVSNSEDTNSLYRAIAQTVGMNEDEYNRVRDAILHEMLKQWQIFCVDVCMFCGKNLPEIEAQLVDPMKMIDKYRKLTVRNSSPPSFELVAAALHFGFSFSIIELTSLELPVYVQNCTNERVLLKSTAKYHFLKTGKTFPCYEYLLPIGPLKKIQDGEYPTMLKDVILIEKHRPWHPVDEGKPRFHPQVGTVHVGFALDHRIFFHRSTISHDLWSLLAELIFRKLVHAQQIKHKIMDSKHDFALYYLACKAKKRYQVRGNASIEKLADDFSKRFSKENPRGDLEDLVQAATYFDFSYTIIGLDSCGNFFWRDYVSQHERNKKNGPYLAFFVKTTPDKSMFWYALEDTGRSCPRERKLYQDVQFGDLRQWGGKFYFHNTPTKVSSFIHKDSSTSKNLLKAPTQMLSQATKWATSNLGKLRTTLASTLSSVSLRARSIFQRVFGVFRGFKKRRHKVQPKKTVEALFIRDQP